eukprot:scaffold237098_cov33-Tisochrysis_lutea.AAC.4
MRRKRLRTEAELRPGNACAMRPHLRPSKSAASEVREGPSGGGQRKGTGAAEGTVDGSRREMGRGREA